MAKNFQAIPGFKAAFDGVVSISENRTGMPGRIHTFIRLLMGIFKDVANKNVGTSHNNVALLNNEGKLDPSIQPDIPATSFSGGTAPNASIPNMNVNKLTGEMRDAQIPSLSAQAFDEGTFAYGTYDTEGDPEITAVRFNIGNDSTNANNLRYAPRIRSTNSLQTALAARTPTVRLKQDAVSATLSNGTLTIDITQKWTAFG